MSMNPYAAPQTDASSFGAGGGSSTPGAPQPWDVGESLRGAWELYKANWAPLTFGYFVVTLIGSVPGQVAPILSQTGALEANTPEYWAVHGPLTLVGWVIAEFFAAGFVRATLRAARGGTASFGDFFGAGSRFLSFLGMAFLRNLAIVLGLIVFIVPGVILALGFMMAPYYVVDQNLGPVASLKASWNTTEGQKGNLFVLALAQTGIGIVGLLACCIGFYAAAPIAMLASTIVYMRMSGTAAPPPDASAYGPGAGYPPPGPPGGGYGGPPGGYGGPPGGYGPPGYGPPGGGPPGY